MTKLWHKDGTNQQKDLFCDSALSQREKISSLDKVNTESASWLSVILLFLSNHKVYYLWLTAAWNSPTCSLPASCSPTNPSTTKEKPWRQKKKKSSLQNPQVQISECNHLFNAQSSKENPSLVSFVSFRDLCVCLSLLFLILCINYNTLSSDRNHLIKAAKKHLMR